MYIYLACALQVPMVVCSILGTLFASALIGSSNVLIERLCPRDTLAESNTFLKKLIDGTIWCYWMLWLEKQV